jgi:membrane peptidoglycan carboxypeptidase
MRDEDYISPEQYQQARDQTLEFTQPAVGIKAPHFVLWVKEQLVEKFGERLVEQGGLKVTTTLDLSLQDFTQEVIATHVAGLSNRKVSNGAALVTDPKTGEILVMVGSADYFNTASDGNVNVTLRPRQPGSSIKPLNYALAMEKKILTPASLINDIPTCFSVTGQPVYCPVNYDGSYRGPIQARFALGNSVNVTAVKVLALNGIPDFINKAREMGITTWGDPKNYGLSLTLGGGEVTMYDMATAFSAFANLGIRQDLFAIKKVENLDGETVYERQETEGPRVLSMEVAYLISHILLDNNARAGAFGGSSYLVVSGHPEVSVKTGTTNDYRDAWTIGYTPSRLAVVWAGNNDNSQMAYGTAGAIGAAPAWNRIISEALKDNKQEWQLKPEGIIGAHVCALSGKAPNPASPCATRFEYFYQGTVPAEIENLRQLIEVDKAVGQPADFRTPPENRELQEHTVVYDILNVPFCLDCPVATPSSALRYPLTQIPESPDSN